MLRSSLCDYSDAYIVLSRTIIVAEIAAGGGNNSIQVVFKNFDPFNNCISEINDTQRGNAKDIDVVMSIYNLIEYSKNYSKTLGGLWQYYVDKPALNDASALATFTGNGVSFKFKQKITSSTGNNGKRSVEIVVLLNNLSNFWWTLGISLINCGINFILNWLQIVS